MEEALLTFAVSVLAGVVVHLIGKWLDRKRYRRRSRLRFGQPYISDKNPPEAGTFRGVRFPNVRRFSHRPSIV